MIYSEKTISSEEIFSGRIIKVKVDKVEMPDGSIAERELVEHPGGVGVIAVNDKGEIVLVRQYRKPFDDVMYEIPAGKLDSGEHHSVCGVRELSEETGLTADNMEYLGCIYPSPGFTNEITYVYYATGLHQGETHPDEDEFLDVEYMPFEDAYKMVMNNEINDAKSVFGILKVWQLRSEDKNL